MASSRKAVYSFAYLTCRNISAPEDEGVNRRIYSGHAPTSSVLNLEDNENVREYLVDAQGKQRRRPTLVHQAIRKTLRDTPDQFSILNGGMVIVARSATVDDKQNCFALYAKSDHRSQSSRRIRRYFEEYGGYPTPSQA